MDSSRIYQGDLGGVDQKLLRALERVTVGDLKPDLTFVLDAPVDIAMMRAEERRGDAASDRFESEPKEFHEKLRDAFRMLALSEPNRCVLIDASGTRSDVADQIWSVVSKRLDPATAPVAVEDLAS
jgi:dTMP kinase